MESNVDKQATIKPLPVSDYELSPEAAAKIAKTEAEIKRQKEKIDALLRKKRAIETAEKQKARKQRTQRLIITGANIEKVLGFIPDMGLLLGIISEHKHFFNQKEPSEQAVHFKRIGDEIIVKYELQNNENKKDKK